MRKEDITWPTYDKDFFPYYTGTESYNKFWSGFYTTRPNFKLQIKQASGVFNAASGALAKMFLKPDVSEFELVAAEAALGSTEDWLSVLQHHDAITGTHMTYVSLDYLSELTKKLEPSRKSYTGAIYDRVVSELG